MLQLMESNSYIIFFGLVKVFIIVLNYCDKSFKVGTPSKFILCKSSGLIFFSATNLFLVAKDFYAGIPIEVGGGFRHMEDIHQAFDSGIEKVILGTSATV